MPRILKVGLWSGAVVLLVSVSFVWLVSANTPKRERYLIPEGYFGWLCVTYSVSGAPPLEIEDGYRLVKFSPSGVVETSTEGMPGKYKDEFWFYGGNTLRKMNSERTATSVFPSQTKQVWSSQMKTAPNPRFQAMSALTRRRA